jgi:predicted DNA binding CopG/RHH family protein
MKPVQFFTDEYLKTSRKASPTQIAIFLDDYRSLHSGAKLRVAPEPTKLISIRLPIRILARLKALSKEKQIPYQTLMKQIIENNLK